MLDLALPVKVGQAVVARVAGLLPALSLILCFSWCLATVAAQPAEQESADVLLILDASGSMFNELDDGRYRITAAKEAMADLISRLPESQTLSVGLRIYGSQMMALDDGACEDSVLRVPVGPVARELLLTTVQGTEALGATPIAYSLQRAAEDLAGAAGRKVVVLVTDGEESCGGDVRAVAERLASEGFEIDLHIIGFALSPEAARSFEGIGTFQSAGSAAELAAALVRAVELPPTDSGLPVTVRLTRDGQPAADGAAVTFRDPLKSGEHVFPSTSPGEFRLDLPPGSYVALVSDAYSDAPISVAGLAVSPDASNEFAFELAPAFEVTLTVSPEDPVIGGRAEVSFSGAHPAAFAWLTVTPVAAPDDLLLAVESVVGESGTAQVTVPFEESELEARYHLIVPEGGTRVVGRSAPFTARRVAATLEAPPEVASGAGFQVAWEGPANQGDLLTVAPAGADSTTQLSYAFTAHGNPAALTAPVDPGAYEVRYVAAAGGGVLATLPLQVVASEVAVDAPAEVGAGTDVTVTWQGPDGPGDMVVFAPQGAPASTFLSYSFTAWGPSLELVAPVEPGTYEVRYLSGSEQRALASSAVNVMPTTVNLRAPEEVGVGDVFTVDWTGPGGSGDYVTIAPVGSPDGTALSTGFTAWGPTLELTAPEQPGDYEVRYFAGFARVTLARVPLTVR